MFPQKITFRTHNTISSDLTKLKIFHVLKSGCELSLCNLICAGVHLANNMAGIIDRNADFVGVGVCVIVFFDDQNVNSWAESTLTENDVIFHY